MSFFDKFFSNRQRNNNENVFKPETKRLRSSYLTIPKDQIRFVLFRECDKRGRKLLFDSYSVEKVPLSSTEKMCNHKCQHQSEKSTDFIETNKTHGYKYKKPPSDVFSLGEMVFGSVAVIYKAENSCKIHSIPSPKRLMFTSIVHAPFCRSPGSLISEFNIDHSSGISLSSLTKILSQRPTSSSDSKLYKHEGVAQKYSSTYPWIKQSFPVNKTKQCCEISGVDYNMTGKSYLQGSSELRFSDSSHPEKRTNEPEGEFLVPSKNNLFLCQKDLECEGNSLSNYGSSGITSNESGNVSSVSGSASSLRRRWDYSYSTSLDSTTFEDMSNSPSKKRTKLGLALILDLSNTSEDEIERLLFNHTIVIDGIMSKLQDSVEMAYIKNENFVDLIYTAFLECQGSICELITGGKYENSIWSMILGDPEDCLETQVTGLSLNKNNSASFNNRESVNSMQLKFLNEFCDVLAKFDTKDTNFFISTLLTAVLTHHLSWVPTVAETDPSENLSVINNIRPYNPLWAQMNDLCGLLGSPLKCAKTVITGPESRKDQLATIVEVLTYFVRCNNLVENIFDFDLEDTIASSDLDSRKTVDSVTETDGCSSFTVVNFDKGCFNSTIHRSETEKSSDEELCCRRKLKETSLFSGNDLKPTESGKGMKRSKSRIRMEESVKASELYPDIKDLAEKENIRISDLNDSESGRTNHIENFLSSEQLKEKIQKMIRVPSDSVKPHAEEYLSPDEGYETIDSTKTDNFRANKVQMERQRSAPESKKENIVFLLGENEELINLQKKVVVNKSSFVDMEKEDSKEFSSEEQNFSGRCGENQSETRERTLNSDSGDVDRTFWDNGSENLAEHSPKHDRATMKMPWIVREISMPRMVSPCRTRRLEVSSVLGGVNQRFRSEQVVQGVLEPMNLLEQALQKDLFLSAHNPILEKNVTEALCIVGDMDSWEVTILSSNKSILDCTKRPGVRVGMSQLVADMLESFLCLHTSNVSPSFCLLHLERKLHEIYQKSKLVAELLSTRELCSMDYLTTSLDIGISDVPLLMSVATTHSPHIAEKYVLSYS